MSTPVDSPHVLLTRAADKLTELAKATASGPWLPQREEDTEDVVRTPSGYLVADQVDYDDSQWIAMFSPLVAPHLVAWLRSASDIYAMYDRRPGFTAERVHGRVGVSDRAAFALALTVLGMEAETP